MYIEELAEQLYLTVRSYKMKEDAGSKNAEDPSRDPNDMILRQLLSQTQ